MEDEKDNLFKMYFTPSLEVIIAKNNWEIFWIYSNWWI